MTGWFQNILKTLQDRQTQNISIIYCIYCMRFNADADRRLRIFHDNLKTAEKLQELDQGSAEYGVTKFSDLTGVCVCALHVFPKNFLCRNICSVLFVPAKNLKEELCSFCFEPEEEFRSTYLNPLLSQWTLHRPMKPAPSAQSPAPASWDWRDHGAVSSVKDQVRRKT